MLFSCIEPHGAAYYSTSKNDQFSILRACTERISVDQRGFQRIKVFNKVPNMDSLHFMNKVSKFQIRDSTAL